MAQELQTEDCLKYNFFPITRGSLHFEVQAARDAHVTLTNFPYEVSPMYEIVIGTSDNTESMILCDNQLLVKASTPNILSCFESKEFWIQWKKDDIQIGKQNAPFLTLKDPFNIPIGYYGVKTGSTSNGMWLIEGKREIFTVSNQQYQFWPLPCGAVTIDICSPSNAHITLISSPTLEKYEDFPHSEIFIGCWGNSSSVIRHNGTDMDRKSVATPAIITNSAFRRFRIQWNNGKVSLLSGYAESSTILEHGGLHTLGVTHYGVRTPWGSYGLWRIKEGDDDLSLPNFKSLEKLNVSQFNPLNFKNIIFKIVSGSRRQSKAKEIVFKPVKWVNVTDGKIPFGAFVGGRDYYCELFIGRAYHNNELLPGKVNPHYKFCYVTWRGQEYIKNDYQVLCGTALKWSSTTKGIIPANAVHGGITVNGEILYIGRTQHLGYLVLGKVLPSQGVCYFSYDGKEYPQSKYEILVHST